MEFQFTPDSQQAQIEVPFFEDARADFAPYYRTSLSLADAQREIGTELSKLGAIPTGIIPGVYSSGKTKRYGFAIRFMYGGMPGVINAAGLPMRSETQIKKKTVQVQALLNVRDWLKAAVTARVFSPGSDVLIPYLLVDGKHTVAEYIADRGKLPSVSTPMLENGATEIVID